jgi:hypothetical protein
MQPQTLDARVERLERRVTILEELPPRVDALTLQVSQLREEMRAEFSAIRREMQTEFSSVRDEMRAMGREIMDHARMLYENHQDKLKVVDEGRPPRRRTRSKK